MSFTAQAHALDTIRAAIANAIPDHPELHDQAAQAVVAQMSRFEWDRTDLDVSTHSEPDKVMPTRWVTAQLGHQSGALTWQE